MQSNGCGVKKEVAYGTNEDKNTTLTDFLWQDIPANIAGYDSEISGCVVTKNGKKGRMTVRELFQWIGTELFRNNMAEDFLVRATLNQIAATDCDVAVITDGRFPNEVTAIQVAGGIVVRLHSVFASNNDPHPSETSLNTMDRLTVNGRFVCESISQDDDSDAVKVTSLTRVLNRGFNYILQNDIKDREILKYTIDKLLLDLNVEETKVTDAG